MSIRTAILFNFDGKPTYILLAQARAKTSLQSLQGDVPAAEMSDGTATQFFRSWWNAAFPDRKPLPDEAIANRDGTGTDAFWQVFV